DYLDNMYVYFFFQAEDFIRVRNLTGVQTCALPIWRASSASRCAVRSRSGTHSTIRNEPNGSCSSIAMDWAAMHRGGPAGRRCSKIGSASCRECMYVYVLCVIMY